MTVIIVPQPILIPGRHYPPEFLWTMIGLNLGALFIALLAWIWTIISDWRFYRRRR